MSKYLQLVSNTAERVAEMMERGVLLNVDLEIVEALLSAAERKIGAANKAG